jgi:hypothetical protein
VTDEEKPTGIREVEAALAGETCLNLPVTTIDPAEIYLNPGYPTYTANDEEPNPKGLTLPTDGDIIAVITEMREYSG